MNHSCSSTRLSWIVSMLALAFFSGIAQGEPANPGIYIGSFLFNDYGSTADRAGLVGLFVPESSTAVIATFPTPSIDAFARESSTVIRGVSLGTDGTFCPEKDQVRHAGRFTAAGVSGDYRQWSCDGADWGDFAASLVPNAGPLKAASGLYSGTLSGKVTLNGGEWADLAGTLAVMVAGSGVAFVTVDACALHGTTCTVSDNGNVMEVGPDGAIDGLLLNGTRMVGQLDLSAMGTAACCSAQGTFSGDLGGGYASAGTWSITREIPLNSCQTFGCSVGDAIAVLRLLGGLGIGDYPIADLTGNGRIGLEEALYTLQKAADLR